MNCNNEQTLTLSDFNLYGSDRLGTLTVDKPLANISFTGSQAHYMGNVLATVSDYAQPQYSGTTLTGFTAQLLTAQDYYPFGSIMPGRSFSTNGYRFGFNGKEMDNEWVGSIGSNLDFGARIYDSRIGRWLSVDPLAAKYPHLSPYNAFENNPIIFKDIEGKEAEYSVNGTTITVKATIYLMNSNATSKQAESVQNAIMDVWKGPHNYENGGTKYTMNFEVTVKTVFEYKEDAQMDQSANAVVLKDKSDLKNGDSDVIGGFFGLWDKEPGLLKVYAHEFGHMLGLGDQYFSLKSTSGWEKDIRENGPGVDPNEVMGLAAADNSRKAKVTTTDIKALGDYIMKNKSADGKGIIKANGLNLAGADTEKKKQHYITSQGYEDSSK